MISVAEAYALGPDGKIDMDLFQQFANQQNAMLTPQGGTGSSMGSPQLTLGQQYMAGNPDVQQDAIRRAQAEGLTGGDAYSNRLDQFALDHFNNFGRAEGRSGYGYSAPIEGSFNPSPNDTPSFGAPPPPPPPPPGSTGGNTMPGTMQAEQPAFNNSGYQTALNNFGGLLNNYGDFFGGLLSGAQNAQTNMQPQGQNYSGFYGPQQAATGFGGGFNNFGNFGGALSGGFSNASTWGGGSSSSSGGNTGHRQLWTT